MGFPAAVNERARAGRASCCLTRSPSQSHLILDTQERGVIWTSVFLSMNSVDHITLIYFSSHLRNIATHAPPHPRLNTYPIPTRSPPITHAPKVKERRLPTYAGLVCTAKERFDHETKHSSQSPSKKITPLYILFLFRIISRLLMYHHLLFFLSWPNKACTQTAEI